jgi:hypothetical protein
LCARVANVDRILSERLTPHDGAELLLLAVWLSARE